MASLNFKGKNIIWNHHLSVPYHTLDADKELSYKPEKADGNLIIEGDNLLALKSLLPKYTGKIKCIYIDPPYNTGNEGWVYNDKVNSPLIKEWLDQEVGKDDLTRHDKWLCMMTPRLKLLRELLKEDGFIFISIDDNELHHLRSLMNEIFSEQNYVTTITWRRKKETANDNKGFAIKGEYILAYGKSASSTVKQIDLSEDYIKSSYKEPTTEYPLGKWRPVPIAVSKGHQGGGYVYSITTPSSKQIEREWLYPEESYKELLANKRIYFGQKSDGIPQRVIYEFESEGTPPDNIWLDAGTNKEGKKQLEELIPNAQFDNVKPTLLIKRLLMISSNKTDNDIILDSFAGSGTTAQAVLELNKEEDGGNRKFILIQMTEANKKEPHKNVCKDITQVRIQKAIEKHQLSSGFSYLRTGTPIDAEAMLSGNLPAYNELAKYIYYLASGKSIEKENEIDESTYYVGTYPEGFVYLIYHENMDRLTKLALTLDIAQAINKMHPKGKKVVYAPACYLDEDYLDEHNIQFVSVPYNLFDRVQ